MPTTAETTGTGRQGRQGPVPHACDDRVALGLSLTTYSVAHLVVDLACAMLVVGIIVPSLLGDAATASPMAAIVAYNLMAFAFQLPIGMLADRRDDNAMVATWGCVTVMLGYLVAPSSPLLAAVVAGTGNAMFHVGGGIETINLSGTARADLPGIFVSTGAMGLFLGMGWDALGLPMPQLPIALLAASGIAIVTTSRIVRLRGACAHNPKPVPGPAGMGLPVALVLAGMLSAVTLRSLLGFSLSLPWKSGLVAGLLCTSVVVLGKALGGVVGDHIGWERACVASLLPAAALFLLSETSIPAGLAALLLFNMTMPLTLAALADTFRHNRGMAFGMTTLALFVGWGMSLLPLPSSPVAASLGCLVTLVAMGIGFQGHHMARGQWESVGTETEAADGATPGDGTER